jgi:hypothetical protein
MSTPASDATNKYAVRARSLYLQASVAWAAGYIAENGRSLSHYIALTLLDARRRSPEARNWEFEALGRRIQRLMEREYDLPTQVWRPLPDDPGAWVYESQVEDGGQRALDEWLGLGQGDY